MTSNLMDTEPGGEQTIYEGEYSDMLPPKKLAGSAVSSNPPPPASQTDTNTFTTSATSSSQPPSQNTAKSAEPLSGGLNKQEATREGSIGKGEGTATSFVQHMLETWMADVKAEDAAAAKARREQGYGGEEDMDRRIGA